MIELVKRGLAKRSSNVVLGRYQKLNKQNEILMSGSSKPIELNFGLDLNGEKILVKINDEREYTSRHFAIAGTTGSGKTQFVFDILNQISKQTDYELKFTFFDFKGTDTKEKLNDFLNSTNAEFIKVDHNEGFPFSPLKNYDLSNQNYIESFASDLRTFFKDIRQVQSASLVRQIIDYYFDNKKSPSLTELMENSLIVILI